MSDFAGPALPNPLIEPKKITFGGRFRGLGLNPSEPHYGLKRVGHVRFSFGLAPRLDEFPLEGWTGTCPRGPGSTKAASCYQPGVDASLAAAPNAEHADVGPDVFEGKVKTAFDGPSARLPSAPPAPMDAAKVDPAGVGACRPVAGTPAWFLFEDVPGAGVV
jgi:hypothetical protein